MICKFALLLSVLFLSATGLAGTVPNVESLASWKCTHDAGTLGTSSGTTSLVPSPSKDGQSRSFDVSWTNHGGERCSAALVQSDEISNSFSLDLWWFVTDMSHVDNLEFDFNQVLPNGQTVIFGTQCAFPIGKIEFTTSLGASAHWNKSTVPCSRTVWAANTWHHFIIKVHRDDTGFVTYDSATLDGNEQDFIAASGMSSFALGWKHGAQVVNFQIGGDGSDNGTTAYLDAFTVAGVSTLPSVPPSAPGSLSGTIR